MSNFMSGFFKKCKYGGYFVIYLIAFISFIGFGNCETVSNKLNSVMLYSGTTNLTNSYSNIFNNGGTNGTYCIKLTSDDPTQLTFGFVNSATGNPSNIYTLYYDQYGNWICLYGNKSYFNAKLGAVKTISVNYEVFRLTDLLNENITCQNTSCENELEQCQNDYTTCNNNLGTCGTSLNSCNNALGSCMQGNIGTGDYNWSAIFINNIQHIGKSIINITIPEEIQRDYTGTDTSMDITIDGYGYDEQKMVNMIDIQNYKPTSEEMSQLIGKFADFVPLLGICLLFIAIRYVAKRIFRG